MVLSFTKYYFEFCLALFCITSLISEPLADNDTSKIIQLRQGAMQEMWKRVKNITPYVEDLGSTNYGPTEAERDSTELLTLIKKVQGLWGPNTNLSIYSKTNATPAVWALNDYFERIFLKAEVSVMELTESITTGNDDSARQALCSLGNACGSCHANFRRLLTAELAVEASAWSGGYSSDCP